MAALEHFVKEKLVKLCCFPTDREGAPGVEGYNGSPTGSAVQGRQPFCFYGLTVKDDLNNQILLYVSETQSTYFHISL